MVNGQVKIGRLGFPTRRFAEAQKTPEQRIAERQFEEERRIESVRQEKIQRQKREALKAIEQKKSDLIKRKEVLIKEQGRLTEIGSKSSSRLRNNVIREINSINITLREIPKAREAAQRGVEKSTVVSFLTQTQQGARTRIEASAEFQERQLEFQKQAKETPKLTDAQIIKQAEQQLGQSLPAASRKQIIKQVRAGQQQISIPSFQQLEGAPTIQPSGVLRAVEPPATRLEAAQRTISQQRTKGGIRAGIAGFAAVPLGFLQFGTGLVTAPIQTVTGVGKGIGTGFKKAFITQEGFPDIGRVLRQEPAFATGRIVGEVATFRAGQAAIIRGKPIVTRAFTPFTPSFRPLVGEAGARKVTIPVNGGSIDIGFVERGGGFGIPLREQIEFAGRKGVVTGTAQRGLFGPFRRAVTIEKPLPTPGAPQLERALFVSPPGRRGIPEVRISRLGLEPQRPATLLDILGGEITFRAPPRAQAIILQADVAAIPPRLRALARRAGRAGAGSPEAAQLARRLERFQLTPTGQLKPIGFATGEAELLISPGEILERRRRLGVTLIEGRPVSLIEAGIRQTPRARPSTIAERKVREQISDIKLADINRETGIDFSSQSLGRRGTISRGGATTFSLRTPTVRRISARRAAGLSPLVRIPDISRIPRPRRPTRDLPRGAPRLGRGGRSSRAIRPRPIARVASVRTRIIPPTIRATRAILLPSERKRKIKFKGLRKAARDEDLFFVPSFSAKLLNLREAAPLSEFRRQALTLTPGTLRKIPDVTVRDINVKGGLR